MLCSPWGRGMNPRVEFADNLGKLWLPRIVYTVESVRKVRYLSVWRVHLHQTQALGVAR